MSVVSTADPQFQAAVQSCVQTLRSLADYTLPPALDRYIRELGERKEYLGPAEHEQLLALVRLLSSAPWKNSRLRWLCGNCKASFPTRGGA